MADEEKPTTNQYRSLQEIEARQRAILDELARIDDIQEPAEEDLNWQGTLIGEHDALDKKAQPLRQRMQDLSRVRKAAADPENREEPERKQARSSGPDVFVRNSRSDPLDNVEAVTRNLVPGSELRARAAELIERDNKRYELSDEYAQTATVRMQGNFSGKVARHILMTGTPEYREAYRSYLETGIPGRDLTDDAHSRAINLTNASGGYLLPYILDPSIVLTNAGSSNPFRRVSRIVQTTSNAWQGVNSAGVTASFIAEATTAADASPTLGQIQLVPEKGVAWVLGSYEALDDTDFGTQLPGLLGDARDRLESAYFTTGAGSGSGVPLGVVAALGTGNRVGPSATGSGGSWAVGDLYNLQAALAPRWRKSASASFMGNIVFLNRVRALDVYGGGAFWTNLTTDTPASLLGQQVYEASDMTSVTTGTSGATGTGSAGLLFGDFQQFIIVDRVGVSMLYEPMVKGSGNAQLPSGQAGWYMFWRTASGVSTTAAFKYLTLN